MHCTLAAMSILGASLLLVAGCRETAAPQPGATDPPPTAGAPTPASDGPKSAATIPLTVVVQDEAGNPVKDVGVRIMAGEGRPDRATSDARGEVRFSVAGRVQVIVDDPSRAPVMVQPDLKSGGRSTAVITLPPPTKLSGTLLDAEGKPIRGAKIRILPSGSIVPPDAHTDGDGRFTAVLSPGSWRMEAIGDGRSPTWAALEIPGGQAEASITITAPKSASLLVDTDCKAKNCLGATVVVSSANSSFTRYLDAGGAAMFDGLPVGEAVVTVRDDARPSHPLLGEAKVSLLAGSGARVSVTMSELQASASISGVLVERSGKRARTKSGGSLVVDLSCGGFQRRITAAADGTFSAPDLLPGPCTLTGLRIDPKDPMSGANGGRIPTRLTAPASDVEVQVNDFFHR